jgi:Tol biopolymer transport system component
VSEQSVRGTSLVFTSNRDGDEDVYATDPVGRRVAALTRNRSRDGDVVVARNGRWLALSRSFTRLVLVRGDGRAERNLGEADPGTFSPDSRLFAFSRENFRTERNRQFIVALPKGRTRAVGEGSPIAFSPNGRLLAFESGFSERLGIVDVGSGRRSIIPRSAFDQFIGWSPDGKLIAFQAREPGRILIANTQRPSSPAVVVLRALGEDLLRAQWLTPRTLAFMKFPDQGDEYEVGTVSAGGGRRRSIARGAIGWMEASSKRGGRIAFERKIGEETSELVVTHADGSNERVVYRGPGLGAWDWSPSGRLLGFTEFLSSDLRRLYSVDANGRGLRRIAQSEFSVTTGEWNWSPDERHLMVQLEGGVGVVSIVSGRVRRVWTGPWRSPQWATRALPLEHSSAAPAPRPEVATGRMLRSRGVVYELAADGPRVTAIVGPARVDCDHLVAWTAGTSRTTRFDRPAPCSGESEPWDFDVDVQGTAITWRRFYCGNFCYVGGCSAEIERPFRRSCFDGDEVAGRPPRPAPRDETHAGLSIETRGGTIHLRRLSDGRARTIRPPGGAVDAELEDAGVFYAFNLSREAMHGRIVFVPRASIFAS